MLIHHYEFRFNISKDNDLSVLVHIRDSGFTSAKTLSSLLGKSLSVAYKILARLEKKNMLRRHRVVELGITLWGVTELGILMSWSDEEKVEPRNAFQPSKLSPLIVSHELNLQMARIRAEKEGWEKWINGHLLREKLQKRPDAVAISPSGLKHSIELEAHSKSRKRLEIIMSTYLQEVKKGTYDYIAYIAPTADLARRLRRLFHSIEAVPVSGVRVKLLDQHYDRFKFYSLDGWPNCEIDGGTYE